MSSHVTIIAEAGVNHNGDIQLAKKLIDAAADSGADYVKFQTFVASKIISRKAPRAEYQVRNTGKEESQLEMVRKLELSEADHWELQSYCQTKGIGFLSTPFDFESIDLLKRLGVGIGKIPSGEIINLPYLRKMAVSFEELILSTGMATMPELSQAVDILVAGGASRDRITVLHCNTEYPTPMKDVNLKAMLSIEETLGVKTGYSDHTLGIEVPIAAVALGATMIEKHFTLDKDLPGPDHKASLDTRELSSMARAIRNISLAISGSGIKEPSASEIKNIRIVRRSIVALRHITEGEIFSEDNIGLKRPGNGMSPMDWDKVLGSVAKRDFAEDDLIEL